ncbi:MAG: P-II family nitrogen regulator [Rikenellaceae bacterium]
MKLIMAIIRIAKLQDTKKALSDVDLPSFTAMAVTGRGKGHHDEEKSESVDPEYLELMHQGDPRLKSKRMITLVVADDKKDLAVETIIKANQTGKSGDGKIFVVNATESVRVRTGETGEVTVD